MEPEFGSSIRDSRLKLYKATLCLAYQSFGVVYGDLSTSPIYVYKSTFSGKLRLHEEDHEILGVLSLIFWTLTLFPLFKYILFVLGADDNGEGGTFALYSLLCRRSRMGLHNTSHSPHDLTSPHNLEELSGKEPMKETQTSKIIKGFFDKYETSRIALLLFVLLGTGMLIGDGVLTPTMSVLSAVNGIEIKVTELHENYTLLLACIILLSLFALQHYGTQQVGFLFAPIMIAWLLCITGVGIYNIFRWNPHVICALSPYYIYDFFKKTGIDGFHSLGGVVLCLTGAEAMFADLGHFSQFSIRIAFTGLVYPCLVLAYMGEAAYLTKNKLDLHSSFYKAIPDVMFWPVFIIATLATVTGSQAIISATFSIISQCRAMRCFPRVKVIHTSNRIHGQIYIPEINWILMLLCLTVVLGFRDTDTIGHAYGLAVTTVMLVTTFLMFLIICIVWNQHVLIAFIFLLTFGSVELVYFSACLSKVKSGGWLPLLISFVIMSVMSIWQYGTIKKDAFELQNRVQLDTLLSLGPSLGLTRVPGICFIYSKLPSAIPPMFAHFSTHFPALHQMIVFITVQSFMVPKVPSADRFLVGRIGAQELGFFFCIARYGYKDMKDSYNFETDVIDQVAEFLKYERQGERRAATIYGLEAGEDADTRRVGFKCLESSKMVREMLEAKEAGVAYMIGNTNVKATGASSLARKFAIDNVYGFLRQNCRRPANALGIPQPSLIEVGMLYHV